MNAMTLILALADRGIELTLDPAAGRVNAYPASKLTDEDRANIRHHLPTIKRLLSVDYTDLPDGWQVDSAMPERVILVNRGALMDSCLFRTEAGSRAFMVLIAHGFTSNQAFHAAAAIEDGEHDPVKLEAIARAS
ncbi:MAG: hypothetical protein PHF20_08495 [Halothiobacillaceae bacterium]|nr:hypothetical protein [Halothiobacillaceae bacterium]